MFCKAMVYIFLPGIISLCYLCVSADTPSKSLKMNDEKNYQSLAPCQACKALVNSFEKGMDRTARGKFEGGDSAWEESKLKKYSRSEIRLTEIQEKLCSEVSVGQAQCHHLAEVHEELIESWWQSDQDEAKDLHGFLCIDNLKVCCPKNHYGRDCKPCLGDITNPCSGHGRCKGNGTRKGSGECACDSGYTGTLCTECKTGFYRDNTDSSICNACDVSCKGHCRGSGPKACEVCQDGYRMTEEFGCGDIDECIESNPCDDDEFCANTYGSHICTKCHESCEGCTGDGPDFCTKCAADYVLKNDLCIKYDSWRRSMYVVFARYATYLGLTIATFIILNRNTLLASIIGVCVAMYIAISEYTVKDEPNHLLGTPTLV